MKTHIYCILLLLFFAGCYQKEKKILPISFRVIDFSYNNEWGNFYSIKLYDTGQVYALIQISGEPDMYTAFAIERPMLDSVSQLADKILRSTVDSVYEESCHDCGIYHIIIESDSIHVESTVWGISEYSKKEEKIRMDKLVTCLLILTKKQEMVIADKFVFKSREKGFPFTSSPPALPTE